MAPTNADKFTDEIDSRLSELFAEKNAPDLSPRNNESESLKPLNTSTSGDSTITADPASPAFETDRFSHFTELKTTLLSIEWEITDESMRRLILETNKLQNKHRNNPVILSFLKLLESVGKYINHRKANAHPRSIQLLHSIYQRLEEILTSSAMTETEIKKILSEEVRKFKKLQQLLQNRIVKDEKPFAPEKGKVYAEEQPSHAPAGPSETETKVFAPEPAPMSSVNILLQKVDELEIHIKKELQKIREELNLLNQ